MPSPTKTSYPLWLLPFCLLATECYGNQYDPHLFPDRGPFFEGWYMRIVDSAQHVSIGFLFGHVLPANSSVAGECMESSLGASKMGRCASYVTHRSESRKGDKPEVIASVLIQDGKRMEPLKAIQSAFPVADFSVRVKGGPVVHNPDDKSPPDFAVRFGKNGSVTVTANLTVVDMRLGSVKIYLRAIQPVPWGPGGEGPESWLEHLPLPLHWFVYSLRSTVTAYRVSDTTTGRTVLSGHNARLHMEKNWGHSFPSAWVWLQGVTLTNVTWAVSGGVVDFDILNVTAFLAGYRNLAKNISVNFTPVNSWVSFFHDACLGVLDLNLTALNYRLEVRTVSPMMSFSQCLLGPEKDGFRPACVESYDAVTSVKVFQRQGLHFVLVDQTDIAQAALEFGGLYVCKQKCSSG